MPALRPRRGSPGPSRKPKAGGPQRERPTPRNRNERKTETKSKRKEKQRQKQIKNKTGPKPKRKKRRRRSNPAAAAPRSHLTRALPKRAANPKIRPQPTPPSQAKPKQGQAKARPSRSRPRVNRIDARAQKKRKRPWIRPRTPTRPETTQGCGARKLCAAIQTAILTCAGRNCLARAAFAPLRRPIATCFERAFGVEAGARTRSAEASARQARRPNLLVGRRRQGFGARPKVGMNFA